MMLRQNFFDDDAIQVAKKLLGKVLRVKYQRHWLSARIIETEAYYLHDKASHASLGFTKKRKALFMSPGTIYMYYARGADSLNVSCRGEGNAVLIKSAFPYDVNPKTLTIMQALNPNRDNSLRPVHKLCNGQTLLCKSLSLKVTDWDQGTFDKDKFFIEDVGYQSTKIIQARRLGIPKGRDEHLLYRFVDYEHAIYCTQNPLSKRNWRIKQDYYILQP